MASLHSWAGILTGWILYFVFLTGTFGYVNAEIDRWMRPELPQMPVVSHQKMADVAESRLRAAGTDAAFWVISLPGGRSDTQLVASWRAQPASDGRAGKLTRETLDPQTGTVANYKVRETGGGTTLYVMHYAFHYIPKLLATWIVGICSMFMLTAILSGIVTHRKIFTNFFTFRPGKGQISWLDGHNLLSVTALPFHIMITWSGLVFFIFTYMPLPVAALYPEAPAQERALQEAYGQIREERQSPSDDRAKVTRIAPLVAQAERLWGVGAARAVRVDHPGRANATITIRARDPASIGNPEAALKFDGLTGKPLSMVQQPLTAPGMVSAALLDLHQGHFSSPLLRAMYVISGLMGTLMVATGLVHWTKKRTDRLGAPAGSGSLWVDAVNAGTIVGLPMAIALYFLANRLIAPEAIGREAWEVHAMFLGWAMAMVWAIVRRNGRNWIELSWATAFACILIPIVNAAATNRGLVASIIARDWVVAGFDVAAIATAAAFGLLALGMMRRSRAAKGVAR